VTLDFRALFDSLPGPCLVLNADFTIEAVNDAYLLAHGHARAALVGEPVLALFPDLPGFSTDQLRASLLRLVQGAERDCLDGIGGVAERTSAPDERCWKIINTALRDSTGTLTHILHRREDVTELMRAQQREARLREEIST
jgi:PAS domain-containing protein